MARRKAARASKQFLPANAPAQGTPLAPVTSTLASGLSRASTLLRNRTRRGGPSSSSGGSSTLVAGNEGPGKRPTSGFGFWRIPSVDSTVAEEREDRRRRGWQEQGADDEADVSRACWDPSNPLTPLGRQIALSYQPPRSPASFNRPPGISRPSSTNPFETSPPHAGIHSTGYPIPAPGATSSARPQGSATNSPSRTTQPGIETEPVPLLRPLPSNYDPHVHDRAQPRTRTSTAMDGSSSEPPPPHHSRMESASSGWKGPHWYGGASGGGYSEAQGTAVAGVRRDRWWHALCAWGDDLDDGGEDGQVRWGVGRVSCGGMLISCTQAGRTNPFE